ncbi:MAG TPA: maleylpyruvate isomerase N-terminal domain-containing protein [Candidatus Limnocylindrales bacterium]
MTDRSYVHDNRAATADLRALVESLTDADLAVDLGEGWTVGMALAHLAFWDEWHVARWLHAAGEGELAPPAADDVITNRANEALLSTWQALPARAAVRLVLDAADAADAYVADLADEAIDAARERGGSRWFERAPHRRDHIGQISHALGR